MWFIPSVDMEKNNREVTLTVLDIRRVKSKCLLFTKQSAPKPKKTFVQIQNS